VARRMKYGLILAVLLVSLAVPMVGAITTDHARAHLANTYVALKRAETAGGNVTALSWRLNEAADLIDAGGSDNLAKARALLTLTLDVEGVYRKYGYWCRAHE